MLVKFCIKYWRRFKSGLVLNLCKLSFIIRNNYKILIYILVVKFNMDKNFKIISCYIEILF